MNSLVKRNTIKIITIIFTISIVLAFIEYFVLRTDQGYIGENIIHKILGVLIIFIVVKKYGYRLYDIGFRRRKIISGFFIGTGLFIITYTTAYILEVLFLKLSGEKVWLEVYSGGFSLTGTVIKNTALYFIIFTIVVNLINSFMEEGLFRGVFLRFSREKYEFKTANIIQSLFFCVWHIVIPIRSVIDGEMSIKVGALMAGGYIIIAFIMGTKLGMLSVCTGSLWAGFFEHAYNNIVVNLLHVATLNGVDNMQIIRIILAQVLSVIIVYVMYGKKKKSYYSSKYKIEM